MTQLMNTNTPLSVLLTELFRSFTTTILVLVICSGCSCSFAQDRQLDLEIERQFEPAELLTSADGSIFLIDQGANKLNEQVAHVSKLDLNLNPIWKAPITVKNINKISENIFSYVNPVDNSGIDYFIDWERFYQILPNEAVTEINTGIPRKELNNQAAKFVDSKGLNFITIVGNNVFPATELKWYTFSHDKLTPTKRSIQLPLPDGIDKKNQSGWRLNEVTESGLYFYYVSFKNDVKDESRPILSCHVIHVDHEGKHGDMTTLDFDVEEYTLLPIYYQQDLFPGLVVKHPFLYEQIANGNYPPTDNAFMGIKIDESSNRIYTVIASNEDIEVYRDGMPKSGSFGRSNPIQQLVLNTFDLNGNTIAQNVLEPNNWEETIEGDLLEIIPLANDEGVAYRFLSREGGNTWLSNIEGEIIHDATMEPFSYRQNMTQFYSYPFTSPYFSLTDFKGSPYAARDASPSYLFFQTLIEKDKKESFYLSMKDCEVIALWKPGERQLTFNIFDKK